MKWLISFFSHVYPYVMITVAIVATFLTIRYDLHLGHNIVLYGLIVSFPLVFSLQSAFKRRDKALEYLGLWRAGLELVSQSFRLNTKLSDEHQQQIQSILREMQTRLFAYLKGDNTDSDKVFGTFGVVTSFLILHDEEVNKRIALRVGKYMSYVYRSASCLIALKTHRTINGVRFFSRVFVTLFPFVQAPIIWHNMHDRVPPWGIFTITIFSALVLGALIVIQQQLEDPFDEKGLDDIRLDKFGLTTEN